MKDFHKEILGFSATKTGMIFSISFRKKILFLKVGREFKFFKGNLL